MTDPPRRSVKVVEGTVTKLIKEMRHGQETVVGVEYKAKDGLKVRLFALFAPGLMMAVKTTTTMMSLTMTCWCRGRNEQQVRSALTVVCDGCFSRFRDQLEEATPRNVSKFVGVLMNVPFPFVSSSSSRGAEH
jgi:hypothetical protein